MKKILILIIMFSCAPPPKPIPNSQLFVAHVLDEMGDSYHARKIYQSQLQSKSDNVRSFAQNAIKQIGKRAKKAQYQIDELILSIQMTQFPQGNFRRFYKLALMYESLNDDNNALIHYENSLQLREKQSSVYLRKALLYERRNKMQEADKLFQVAYTLKSKDPHILFHRAMFLFRRGKKKEAITIADQLASKWPRLAKAIKSNQKITL